MARVKYIASTNRKSKFGIARALATRIGSRDYDYRTDKHLPARIIKKWSSFPKRPARRILRKLRKGGIKPNKYNQLKMYGPDGRFMGHSVNIMTPKVAATMLSRLPRTYRKRYRAKRMKTALLRKSSIPAVSKVGYNKDLYDKISSYL